MQGSKYGQTNTLAYHVRERQAGHKRKEHIWGIKKIHGHRGEIKWINWAAGWCVPLYNEARGYCISFDGLFALRHGSPLRAMTMSLSQARGHRYRPLSSEGTGGGPFHSSCGKRGEGRGEREERPGGRGIRGAGRERKNRRKKKRRGKIELNCSVDVDVDEKKNKFIAPEFQWVCEWYWYVLYMLPLQGRQIR